MHQNLFTRPIFNNDITSQIEEYNHHKYLYDKSNDINFEIVPYHELNGARGAATLQYIITLFGLTASSLF